MRILKDMFKLGSKVTIYVPSTMNVNESFDCSKWVDQSLSIMAQQFGGSTASKALGAWVTRNGELVKENVTLVFSYATTDMLEQSIELVYNFCLEMKRSLAQEAIALEINGDMYMV